MTNQLLNRRASGHRAALVAMVVICTALIGCSSGARDHSQASAAAQGVVLTPAQRERIHTLTVADESFHRSVTTTGTVDFDRNHATTILAPFSGPVTKVLVQTGARVTAGAPLAEVDSPDFAAAVSAYRKALAMEDASHKLAALDKDLLAHHGISRREYTEAQADAIGAAAEADAARQALVALHVAPPAIAAIKRGNTVPQLGGVIRSPLAGTVVVRTITPGQLLQAGSTPCFVIADLAKVWVEAHVFGGDIAHVKAGDGATVQVDGRGKTLHGTVTNVSAQVDPATGAITARVEVPNPDGLLKKGMYVSVRIQSTAAVSGLMVPVAAVLRDEQNLPFVYVLNTDGSFARRSVTLGYRDGTRFEATAGLKAGAKVVTDGSIFLRFIQSQ